MLLSIVVAYTALLTVVHAQPADGEQKEWLTQSYQKASDSIFAPYYRIVRYNNGLPVGPFIDHFRQGSVHRRGTFVRHGADSFIEGIVEVFRETGAIETRETYVKGRRSGPYTRYNQVGTISLKGEFDDDRRSGDWTVYYPSGSVKSQGSYLDGNRDGEWRTYNEDGTISEVTVFSNGAQVDWAFLIDEAEKALDGGRLSEAARSCERALQSVRATLGSASLPYARVHKVHAMIALATDNEDKAVRHFDTAMRICKMIEPMATAERASIVSSLLANPYLSKITKRDSPTFIRRIATEVLDVFLHDTTLSRDEGQYLVEHVNVIIKRTQDTAVLYAAIDWMTRHVSNPKQALDSSNAFYRLQLWWRLADASDRLNLSSKYTSCIQQCLTLTSVMPAQEQKRYRTIFEGLLVSARLFDTSYPWEERRKRYQDFMRQRSSNDTGFCLCFSQAIGAGITRRDTSFIKETADKLLFVCGDSSIWSLFAYDARVFVEIVARRCESAQKMYADLRQRSFQRFDTIMALHDPAKWGCAATVDTIELPALPPLFTAAKDTITRTLVDVLSTTQRSKGALYARGLRSGALAHERIEALLAADSVGPYQPAPSLIASYRSVSDRTKRLIDGVRSPVDRGQAIFRFLHDSVLTKYEEVVPLREVLTSGTYNCVSAVALYGVLCEEYGVPLAYFTSPGHIFCGLQDNDSIISIEITAPEDGFNYHVSVDSLVRHLLTFKLVTPSDVEALGPDSIARRYYEISHRQDFTSVVAATLNNSLGRLLYQVPVLKPTDYYEHGLAAMTLNPTDAASYLAITVVESIQSDDVRQRVPLDAIELARYRGGDVVFSASVLANVVTGLLTSMPPKLQAHYDEAMHVLWSHMPADQSADSLRSVTQSTYALALALKAARNNAPDAALAYLLNHPSSYYDQYLRLITPILTDVVTWLEDRGQYKKILSLRNRFDSVLTPYLSQKASKIALQSYLQGQDVATLADSAFASYVSEFLKLSLGPFGVEEPTEDFMWGVHSNLVARARLDLVTNLIDEATRANMRQGFIKDLQSLHRTMLANAKRPVVARDLKVKLGFRLGSKTGPATESIPVDTENTFGNIQITGLDPGQTFRVQLVLEVPGRPRNVFLDMMVGSQGTSVELQMILPRLKARGNVIAAVLVNDTEISRRNVQVR